MADARIGNLLVKEKLINVEQLEEALKQQREKGGNLGSNLINLGYLKEVDLTTVLAKQLGVKSVELDLAEIDEDIVNLLPVEEAPVPAKAKSPAA